MRYANDIMLHIKFVQWMLCLCLTSLLRLPPIRGDYSLLYCFRAEPWACQPVVGPPTYAPDPYNRTYSSARLCEKVGNKISRMSLNRINIIIPASRIVLCLKSCSQWNYVLVRLMDGGFFLRFIVISNSPYIGNNFIACIINTDCRTR